MKPKEYMLSYIFFVKCQILLSLVGLHVSNDGGGHSDDKILRGSHRISNSDTGSFAGRSSNSDGDRCPGIDSGARFCQTWSLPQWLRYCNKCRATKAEEMVETARKWKFGK